MLVEVCREIKNFFIISEETGSFEIVNGSIVVNGKYLPGQYIAITGSVLNNGVYRIGEIDGNTLVLEVSAGNTTADEAFEGTIYGLRIPRDFLALVDDIKAFNDKQGQPSNIVSESFGAYSYSVATDKDGQVTGWQDTFKTKLNKYRRMFLEVDI